MGGREEDLETQRSREARQRWAGGRNRFAVGGREEDLETQRSREARQRWAGGRNRFAVGGGELRTYKPNVAAKRGNVGLEATTASR